MEYKSPALAVDIIIEMGNGGIVLIRRQNPPHGWAIPGGFVDYGESMETAAVREAKEETMLEITLTRQLHTYSDPSRDPRFHTVSSIYVAVAEGEPQGADDAMEARIFNMNALPDDIVFDHRKILEDYAVRKDGFLDD
ncbi:MAG: NUDIX hydrolase [Gemmatimonadota bacterium]|nr:NUDIX hydrolase [Gemmatimonadota bacterium]